MSIRENTYISTLVSGEIFAHDIWLELDDVLVLFTIHYENASTAGLLASKLALSASKITRLLKSLVDAELIEESIDHHDRRKCLFKVSGKGSNIIYKAEKELGSKHLAHLMALYPALNSSARNANVTSTAQRILLTIHCTHTALTVTDISENAHLSQSKTSMALKKLCDRNLVEQGPNNSDKRRHTYQLTMQGMSVAETMIPRT